MNCRAAQKFGFLVLFLLSFAVFASAQDKNRATANEDFTLNITEERTTETNYQRSTDVEAGGAESGLTVRVGTMVSAQTIDITLRGITGNGRFRASLEKITRRIQDSGFKIQD